MSRSQLRDGEDIMEGEANDVTQKVVGKDRSRRVVDKTSEEMEPTHTISIEKRPVIITNEQWQDVLDRLDKLDNR